MANTKERQALIDMILEYYPDEDRKFLHSLDNLKDYLAYLDRPISQYTDDVI